MAAIATIGAMAVPSGRGSSFNALADDTSKVTTDTSKAAEVVVPQQSVIDEVIWVVGDEPILKSDVEEMRMQGLAEGINFGSDPDFSIPEQIAVQKLFLHQAEIDSIEVTESEVATGVNQQINRWVEMAGSKEKLEEYRKQSISDMRSDLHDQFRDQQLIQKMKESLVKDVKVTPADVRAYFRNLPEDSIPFVPTEVEVEILVSAPRIKQSEIKRVKDELRNFTDRVNKGETTFSTLARLYSEDPGSARQGGELGYTGRGVLDPAFAAVAFNLTDPKKVSKIVESEFGYHIIQLIDKRGDKINARHILLKPKVSADEVEGAMHRLDSISNDIRSGKFSFEEAASYLSDDKDTRNNEGLMSNSTANGMTFPDERPAHGSGESGRHVEGERDFQAFRDDQLKGQDRSGGGQAQEPRARPQGHHYRGLPGDEGSGAQQGAREDHTRLGGRQD